MLRHSKHERSGLYDLLSTWAGAFTLTLRVPDDVRVAPKFYFKVELKHHPAQLPRRLLLFVLIQKVTKKIKSAEMLLCAQGLSRTNPKTLRAGIFLLCDPIAFIPCDAKISYALPDAQAGSVSGFRPKLIC